MEEHYMGFDPSTVSTGYAILNSEGKLVDYGVINPGAKLLQHQKIHYQYSHISDLMCRHKVVGVCSEEQFSGLNADTLKKLCQVTGIIMLLAAQFGVKFTMKYPASWRKDFHGNGAVKKEDTLKLVNEMFGLSLRKKDNDIADAIGMAVVAHKIGKNKL